MHCSEIIKISDNQKVSEVRKKKFAITVAPQNTIMRIARTRKVKEEKSDSILLQETKGELFENSLNWQSARSSIAKMQEGLLRKVENPKTK